MVLKKRLWNKATDDDKYFNQYKHNGRTWKDFSKLSDAALNLVIQMLDLTPTARITAKSAVDYANFHL